MHSSVDLDSRDIKKRVTVAEVIFIAIIYLKNERGTEQHNSYQSALAVLVKGY